MRVAVIGAGMAGLGAARALVEHGYNVVVFEKSKGPGGRATTRRLGEFTFDSGATSIAPGGKSLEAVMLKELDTTDLVVVEKPIYRLTGGRISPDDPGRGNGVRYCYRTGMNTLGKLLAEGLDLRTEVKIEMLEVIKDGGYLVNNQVFDAMIITCPIPQTATLLATIGELRPFQNCKYRSCLSILLGYDEPLETRYHALIDPEQQQPLNWLSVETSKVAGPWRAPDGGTALVAQLGARYSQYGYDFEAEKVIQDTLVDITRLLGSRFGKPVVSQLMRWRYSQPETTAAFETVNRPGSRLIVASDGLAAGRIPDAFESGRRAAAMLMDSGQ